MSVKSVTEIWSSPSRSLKGVSKSPSPLSCEALYLHLVMAQDFTRNTKDLEPLALEVSHLFWHCSHLFIYSWFLFWTHFYHKAESSLSPHGTGEPSDCTMLWTQHEQRRLCSTGIRASLKIFDRSGCGTFT